VPSRGWLAATADDLDASVVFRRYAAVLSTLHVLTGLAWFEYKNVATLVTGDDSVCWPLLSGCEGLRAYLSPWLVRRVVAIYIALGASAALLFLRRRPRAALVTFLAATALGLAVYALDYRMRFNQTYMFACIALVFLVTKRRLETASVLLACFYFWAGTLKLTRDWLTGAALYAPPLFIPSSLLPASCVYVVVLELVLVWGLFSSRAWVRRGVLLQLVLFHVVSYPVVGWFYPLTMFGLLSVFVLGREQPVTFASLRALSSRERRSVSFVAAGFAILQLVPWMFRGDSAVTGEGRLFALHMFDARVACRGGATLMVPAEPPAAVAVLPPSVTESRTLCDPIVILSNVRRACREPWARVAGARLDVAVDAKRASDPEMRPFIRIDDACHDTPTYSLLRENPWIVRR
jgi:hypothetical protein